MTLLSDAEAWAADGTKGLFDEFVRKQQEFTDKEVRALVRAAYGVGYTDALVEEHGPLLSILGACQFATALRLTLPLSS